VCVNAKKTNVSKQMVYADGYPTYVSSLVSAIKLCQLILVILLLFKPKTLLRGPVSKVLLKSVDIFTSL